MNRRHYKQDDRPQFVFQWHLTDECDQRCRHCYIYGKNAGKKPDTMDWDTIQKVEEACGEFCSDLNHQLQFCLTGGDPLLHPDFWRLAELLKKKKILFTILGNPFHLTLKTCKRLKKLGCIRYQLSVDGLEKTHDWFRKPGSYRETLDKIAMLNRAGIESAVMTTVSGRNVDEIPEIIDAMVEAGVRQYAFSRYCPTEADESNGLTPERYRQLLTDCAKKIRGHLDNGCVTKFGKKDHLWTLYDYERGRFVPPADAEEGVIYAGCHCGQTHLTILPDGDVYACRRAAGSRVGHLPEDILMDIWTGPMEEYRRLDRFEKCRNCELLRWCRGCPAVASSADGNFYAADPQCWKATDENFR